jgi:hypothetical protein
MNFHTVEAAVAIFLHECLQSMIVVVSSNYLYFF